MDNNGHLDELGADAADATVNPPAPPIIMSSNVEDALAPQEALGKSILESIANAMVLIHARNHPNKITDKIVASLSWAKHTVHGDYVDILPLLERVRDRVYGCQAISDYDIGDLGKSSLLILNLLVKIDQPLRSLLVALKRNIPTKDLYAAIQDFEVPANAWLLETGTFERSVISATEAADLPPRSTRSSPTVDFITQALGIKRDHGMLRCELTKFQTWCTEVEYKDDDESSERFGNLHALHLFRSKKAPFHHEYVTVQFYNDDTGETCWTRFERGARVKGRSVQADSSGVVRGGVQQRELISFAADESELNHKSDLLASIELDPRCYISMQEFAEAARVVSETFPNYEVFTSNCRWFSRRLFLSVAEWHQPTVEAPQHVINWGSQPSSLSELPSKLGNERFGGREVQEKSAQIKVHSLATLAMATSLGGDDAEGMELYQQSMETLKQVVQQAPGFTSSTIQAGLDWISRITHVDASLPPDIICSVLSPSTLDAYCTTLWESNRKTEAWACLNHGVALSRAKNPSSVDLARRLEKLADYAGWASIDTFDVLPPLEEAVGIHRASHSADSTRDRETFAQTLVSYSNALDDWGRQEEALSAIQEAFVLYRQVGKQHDQPTSGMATAFNNLSNCLSNVGMREDALVAIQESIAIEQALAAQRPDAFNPDLASSLNNLSAHLSSVGRREEALGAIQEAATLYRALAAKHPDAFNPDLASSLNNLSARLSDVDRHEEALDAIQETVPLYRALAAKRPDALNPNLASSLHNLSARLSDVGRQEEALDAIQEAVTLRRALAAKRPDAFSPNLASSLNNFSARLSSVGRREEALDAIQEAVTLRRALAAKRPDAYNPDLATSLYNMSINLLSADLHNEALAVAQEAVTLYRALAAERPVVFQTKLVHSLEQLSLILSDLGNDEAAREAQDEADALDGSDSDSDSDSNSNSDSD